MYYFGYVSHSFAKKTLKYNTSRGADTVTMLLHQACCVLYFDCGHFSISSNYQPILVCFFQRHSRALSSIGSVLFGVQ